MKKTSKHLNRKFIIHEEDQRGLGQVQTPVSLKNILFVNDMDLVSFKLYNLN